MSMPKIDFPDAEAGVTEEAPADRRPIPAARRPQAVAT